MAPLDDLSDFKSAADALSLLLIAPVELVPQAQVLMIFIIILYFL